ncbi:dicarboxylate/amino acid:cation symporter [Aliikangiella maris]|uniref:Dicarboxylate/amino acid:cation symporter n=2 Tax=Aliikangiella maris TaxID=3162458 RepID=A0ABV2BUY7_9GAMM
MLLYIIFLLVVSTFLGYLLIKRHPLWQQIIIAISFGVLAGTLFESEFIQSISWTGEVFLRLIKMLIAPVVFFTLIAGICSLDNVQSLGLIGSRAISLYLLTTLMAVSIGLIVGSILMPGSGVDSQIILSTEPINVQSLPATQLSLSQRLINIIPVNPFYALLTGNILSIIFFAIVIGIGIIASGDKAKPFALIMKCVSSVFIEITKAIMMLAPIGIFGLIAVNVAQHGFAVFEILSKLVICVYLACFVQVSLVYGGILLQLKRVSVLTFFRKIASPLGIAFSTASSSGTLPVTLTTVQEKLKVNPSVSGSVLPLGATINMDGTSIYIGLVAIFAAQVFNIPLGLSEFLMIALTTTISSIGAAGVPSSALFMGISVLTVMGLSVEQAMIVVAFILPFDRIFDMIRTMTNVAGDCVVAYTVDRLLINRIDLS